ncbi:hypothetical protein Tco_1505865 [Tanacetum coccineum]
MPDVEPAIEEDNSHLGQWKSIDLENREESSIPLNSSRENPFFILFHRQMWQTVVLSCFTYTNKISAKLRRMGANLFYDPWPQYVTWLAFLEKMETESQASFSIGKETGELVVMETIQMDDMDFFEMVNHFFNREREVIQNPLAPERGAAPEALPQALAPKEVAHPAPDQKERAGLRRAIQT